MCAKRVGRVHLSPESRGQQQTLQSSAKGPIAKQQVVEAVAMPRLKYPRAPSQCGLAVLTGYRDAHVRCLVNTEVSCDGRQLWQKKRAL